MKKVLVEFINTWAGCDGYTRAVEAAAAKYKDKVDVKIYYAGKNMEYVKKYGVIFKGTLIINEKKKIQRISKDIIEKEIELAVKELDERSWFVIGSIKFYKEYFISIY